MSKKLSVAGELTIFTFMVMKAGTTLTFKQLTEGVNVKDNKLIIVG